MKPVSAVGSAGASQEDIRSNLQRLEKIGTRLVELGRGLHVQTNLDQAVKDRDELRQLGREVRLNLREIRDKMINVVGTYQEEKDQLRRQLQEQGGR